MLGGTQVPDAAAASAQDAWLAERTSAYAAQPGRASGGAAATETAANGVTAADVVDDEAMPLSILEGDAAMLDNALSSA